MDAVPAGRIVEVSGSARASVGARILAQIQARGEVVAWVAPRSAGLFPPDLESAGLDLSGLIVVHLPESDVRAGPKAVELLLRTGAVGAVVLDLDAGGALRAAWQGRLLGVLREHDARLVVLSGAGDRESLGPLVSVRLALSSRRVLDAESGRTRFELSARVTKDKSGLLGGVLGSALRAELRLAPRGA
jgi:recombination protein RecA